MAATANTTTPNSATTPTSTTLHTLHRPSGSVTYITPRPTRPARPTTSTTSSTPLTITAAIHHPLDPSRRSDDDPEKSTLAVNIRPASGVGQIRERHLELLVSRTLSAVLMRELFPRQVLSVSLQVVQGGEDADESVGGQRTGYLSLLAGCVNASVLGCMDAGVPMRDVLGAVLLGVSPDGEVLVQPDARSRRGCGSLHVFGFTGEGGLVLAESEGAFGIEEWERLEMVARRCVLGPLGRGRARGVEGDIHMNGNVDGEGEPGLEGGSVIEMMRRVVAERMERDGRWNKAA